MATTLGLDLGTNSIGWALVRDNDSIIDMGVRIFPVGVKEDDFRKQGKEVSKNVNRRMDRGQRRRFHRYRIRRERLMEVLAENGMLTDGPLTLTTKALFHLRTKALDELVSLQDFGRILLVLNKRRGFKSNRKALSNADAKKEEGIVKSAILELQQEIEHQGSRTVGEYFWSLFAATDKKKKWHNQDEPIERIRGRFVGREMYEHEFDLLWEHQSKHYPDILTPELRAEIRDRIIFYQRPLRSQKGLVARCRFEPSKRCTPKSSPLFQEFRIWQQLSALRVVSTERVGDELTIDEKKQCASVLMASKKMTHAEIKKLLKLPRSLRFNDIPDIIGNTTWHRLGEAIGQDLFAGYDDAQRNELWHLLTYADDADKMRTILRRKIEQDILPPMDEATIQQLYDVVLEEGYGNFSAKALKKILPHLRLGLAPHHAFIAAGYDPTKRYTWKNIAEQSSVPPLLPNELRNPIVQQMLSETFRVVNAIVRKHGKPDMIRIELARELKKPKSLREEDRYKALAKQKQRLEHAEFLSARLKKEIFPGSPEVRKYELWLEMGCEDPALDNLDDFMRNGRIVDQKKYRLWKECGRVSPYSGKVISLARLFSPDIQIEHIWPYSKTMDGEFGNLCLCEATINKEKGDRLPYEYFSSKGEKALAQFKERVSRFKGKKRYRFLAKEIPPDFLNSQLNNTRYAARELSSRLETLLPPIRSGDVFSPRVQVINGQATAVLRSLWGLNGILRHGDIDTKNRGDHRHHAVDALIIACSTPRVVQVLSTYSSFDALHRITNTKITPPWKNFLGDAQQSVFSIIVSHRNQKRLTVLKPNLIRVKNLEKHPEGCIRQMALSIRGPLHEETMYGAITHEGEQVFVTRWPLVRFDNVKQLDKVVDPKVRSVLLKRVERYDGNIKKAFADNPDDPVLMYSKQGYKIPIKRVRVINPSESLEPIRENSGGLKPVYVETGNNFCIAIYENPSTGERVFETVPFFTAVRRVMTGLPIVRESMEGCPLLFSVKQNDTVVRYDNHADEIEWDNMEYLRSRLFRVRKFDVNGTIYLDCIYAAKIDDMHDRNRLFVSVRPSTMRAVRVTVDILGNISRSITT